MVQGKHVKTNGDAHARRPGWRLVTSVGYPLAFAALLTLACGPGYAMAADAANNAASDASASSDSAATSSQTSNAPAASAKDETVYIFTKSDGSVKNVTVSDKLSNADKSSELADSSTLSNIENVEGSEEYRGSGSGMVWDANGADIYYRGDSDAQLPVSMDVTYRLDGRTVTADEIAGKSGHVEISYQFENLAKADGDVKVPFAAITGMLLDDDTFRNVEVDNGKVVDDGDRIVAIGYAMPGLADSLGIDEDDLEIPDGFTVSAEATDFELSSTLTMVTGNLFDSADLDDFDADELTDASATLKDAMSQLLDGANQLSDGLGQLADGAGTLSDGTSTMSDKVSGLPDGVEKLYKGSDSLASGLSSMADGTSALASGASSLESGASSLESGARQLDGGLVQLSGGLGQMSAGANELAQGASAVNAGAARLADDSTGIPAIIATVKAMQASGASVPTDHAQVQALETAVTQAFATAGMSDYTASVNGLLEYAYGVNAGVNSLSAAIDASQAEAGVKQLAAGASQVSDGAASLSSNLATAASSAQVMSAGASQLSSGAVSLSAGASQLSSGASTLNDNVPAVVSGSKQLRDGLKTLNKSTGALITGVQQIVEGASQLAEATATAHEGSTSLAEGLAQFNDEGITKITDFLDSDIVKASGNFEAVRKAGEDYTNFSGITAGTTGTVKFVIEADAIEK